jgi:hypothetical protein
VSGHPVKFPNFFKSYEDISVQFRFGDEQILVMADAAPTAPKFLFELQKCIFFSRSRRNHMLMPLTKLMQLIVAPTILGWFYYGLCKPIHGLPYSLSHSELSRRLYLTKLHEAISEFWRALWRQGSELQK